MRGLERAQGAMVKDSRVTYRRRHSYNTASNQVKKVRTPGGRLVVQYVAKKVGAGKCIDTGADLHGIAHRRTSVSKNLPGYRRSVARAYGGVLSHGAVRERILRAFIIEEKKLVKAKVATAEDGAAAAAAPAAKEKKPAKKADSAKAPAPKAADAPKAPKGKGKQ